jgi:protein required for attachment to host cells
MKRVCIAIVDATRARVYTYQQRKDAGQELHEVSDLVNPGRRLRPTELFSDGRQGRDMTALGRGYAFDDHRDKHLDEWDLRFARDVIAELDRVVRTDGHTRIILVASPRMLGGLRKVGGALQRRDLVVDEVGHDLTNFSSPQLHDHLASLQLLPPRQRVLMTR